MLMQVFTEAQKAEMQEVQMQIMRRISIGGLVGEKRMIDELVHVGLDDSLVRKALLYLVQLGELEYRQERRLIHRPPK